MHVHPLGRTFAILTVGVLAMSCGSSGPDSAFQGHPGGLDGGGASDGSNEGAVGPRFGDLDSGRSGETGAVPPPPPQNLVKTEFGGYALGAAIMGDGATGSGTPGGVGGMQTCDTIIGVVRDFKEKAASGGHPDFEAFSGSGPTTGLVAAAIGADRKPVYSSQCEATLVGGTAGCPNGQETTSKAAFDQWYRFTPAVNKPYLLYLQFAPNGNVFTFQSNLYFPLDNAGWGNSGVGAHGSGRCDLHCGQEGGRQIQRADCGQSRTLCVFRRS